MPRLPGARERRIRSKIVTARNTSFAAVSDHRNASLRYHISLARTRRFSHEEPMASDINDPTWAVTGCAPPLWPNCYPSRATDFPHSERRMAACIPGVQEQMGADPISKLAAAIEKLADALREGNRD